jgi:hypothetical protein
MPREIWSARSGSSGTGHPTPGAPSAHTGVFRKEGQFWTVGYGGKSFPLNDSKGLGYLAHLLRTPRPNSTCSIWRVESQAKAMVKKPVNLHTACRAGLRISKRPGSTSAVSATRARCSTIKPRLLIDAGSPSCGKNWKDWEALRSLGFDEMACLEVAHIVGIFNYLTRVADGVGLELHPALMEAARSGMPLRRAGG